MIINGKPMDLAPGTSIASLIHHLNLQPEKVVVEVNEVIVTSNLWLDHELSTGDKVEIVAFVGGG